MAKNDEVKLEVDPEFAAFANVKPMGDRTYCAADTHGVAEVVSITKKSGFMGLSLIFEFKAISSEAIPGTNGVPHLENEPFALVKKLDVSGSKGATILSDAISVLGAIAGLSGTADPSTFPALLTRATSSAQPFKGYRIGYKCPRKEDGRAFMKAIAMPSENTPEKLAARK
jgi:hypothetical protein